MTDEAKPNRFADFNNREILVWYIQEQKHAHASNDHTHRTKKEYERELSSFIWKLLVHSATIDIDIAEIRGQSLFKFLESHHLRHYQKWLMTESSHV
ncbi:hypothetical protein BN1080_00411 [Planococcus massiliensis]|uniref:Uncharacterized protein n=1 Tax=Planococcus massiliensis TaxID=1499687 RepID=A0A098EI74_9BACL|nr:hypothetical protein BN1080_00411 [Planococcus massiliensis]